VFAHAGAQPRTVVFEDLYALVAELAVPRQVELCFGATPAADQILLKYLEFVDQHFVDRIVVVICRQICYADFVLTVVVVEYQIV